jgi:hypothetical protein
MGRSSPFLVHVHDAGDRPESSGSARGSGAWGRWVVALKARPVLCLALLTPGLPEYLSSSSPLLALAVNPAWFFLALAINVGQYTAGALLIREAAIRWRKGWVTVALLAVAYGITEEGLGDNTLFNSTHGVDGVLGHFGRFAGVNWVWACGVLAFHAIFSIGLPLLLLGLAVPATRGRSLLGRRGMVVCFATLATATLVEAAIVLGAYGFWMGEPRFVGSVVAIAGLVAAAYAVRASWGRPVHVLPTARPVTLGVAGFLLFPCLFAVEYGFESWPAAAPLALGLALVVLAVFLEGVRRTIGRTGHEHALVALAFGFIVFLSAFGVLLARPIGCTLPLAVLAIVFCLLLRRTYPAPAATPGRPGALPPART